MKEQRTIEDMLRARWKNVSVKYRKAILILFRGRRIGYASNNIDHLRAARSRVGPGFYQTQREYNGGYNE